MVVDRVSSLAVTPQSRSGRQPRNGTSFSATISALVAGRSKGLRPRPRARHGDLVYSGGAHNQ